MTRRSERSRWVSIFTYHRPGVGETAAQTAREQHDQAQAVIAAFAAVGRVVRVEPTKYNAAIVLKARRA